MKEEGGLKERINLYNIHVYIINIHLAIYIEIYIYDRNYAYTYIIELCQSAQVLELPQSHFGDNQEGTLFVKAFYYVFINYISTIKYCYSYQIYK